MKFTFPKPPSINHIYGYTARGGFARSYITREGQEWFRAAAVLIKEQLTNSAPFPPLTVPLSATVHLYTAYRRDLDNSLKPLFDVLQKELVIENDVLIEEVHAYKHKVSKEEERVEIELEIRA